MISARAFSQSPAPFLLCHAQTFAFMHQSENTSIWDEHFCCVKGPLLHIFTFYIGPQNEFISPMKKNLGSKKFSKVAFRIGSCNRCMYASSLAWAGSSNTVQTPWLSLEGPRLCSCFSATPLTGRRYNAEKNITDWGHCQL